MAISLGLTILANVLIGIIAKPALKLLKKWLTPDLPEKEGLSLPREGSNISIPVAYGRRKLGAITVDKNVTNGRINGATVSISGDKNALLHLIVVFCYGQVEAIDEIQFNGKPSTDAQFKKGNGDLWFKIQTRLGGGDNNIAVNGTGFLNNFSAATSRYEGLCYAMITLEQDRDQTVWRGIPEITAIIRGKRCFDWRTGVTEYTENPAIHLVDYVKSPIYGKSLADSDINYPYFTDVANACEVIESTNTISTGRSYYDRETDTYFNLPPVVTTESFARFSNNTIIDTERSIFNNMQELSNSFRGFFPEPDGRLAVGTEDVATSVFSFDNDNIIGKLTRSTTSRNDRFNRVVVKFPNKINDYEMDEIYYPDASSQLYADWLVEDNDVPLETTINADHCVYKAEALQLGEVAAKVSRNSDQVNFIAMLEAAELDIGDVIDITDSTRGWVGVLFRISELSFNDDGTVGIAAILHNNTVYPWSGKTYDEQIGGIFLGDPTNVATPSNLQFTPDPNLSNSGTITWDHADDAFSRIYRVQVLTTDATPVVVVTAEPTSKRFFLPLINQGSYTISVVAISTIGTISGAATIGIQLIAPVTPTDIVFITNDWGFEVQPAVVGGIGSGSTFEFDYVQGNGAGYTPTSRANGASYTATGLIPNTLYTAYARTVNAFGASTWYNEATTTTQVGAQVQPFLENIETELQTAQDDIDALDIAVALNLQNTTDEIDIITDDIASIEGRANRDRFQINTNIVNTESVDLELLRGLTNDAQSRELLRQTAVGDRVLIDASVFVDPESGLIINRAFLYSDGLFTQADLRIDGADGAITAAVDRIEVTESEIIGLSAELALIPGQITATATAIVSESIAALEPAFTFNFFDSAQGWVAINGAVTSETNQIAVTWGDIENTALGYSATDNKLIRILIERISGSGWNGSVVITRDNATTETFTAIIAEPASSGAAVILIDFSGLAEYSGTITGVRLSLGVSVTDTFDITSITIGRPDATTQDLQSITARITQAEVDINANEAQITQRVTVTDYNNETVTFSNVESTVDGLNSIISLEATRQSLIANNTISVANTAAVDINALDGTVSTLAETVNLNETNNQAQFTQASTEINAIEGEVTNSVFGVLKIGDDAELAALTALLAEVDIAKIRKLDLDTRLIFGDAIQQLNVDVSPTGVLAESILNLTAAVNLIDVQVVATLDRVEVVEADDQGNASAISAISGKIDDPSANSSALFGFVQQAQTDADANTTSITGLTNSVNAFDNFATSQLILNSGYTDGLSTLTARAFLGIDINNRVSGINIEGQAGNSTIDFIGDKIRFLNPDDFTIAFQWDSVDNIFVFGGKIVAVDSTFTGEITASIISGGVIIGGAISGGSIDATVITGTTMVGGVIQAIGTSYMKIISGDSFGVNSLMEWYGAKSATTFNATTGRAILSGLTKVNGDEWKDDQGVTFTSGTIIAGTLTVSRQDPSITNTPTISTGVFGSNGGQIAINCSVFGNFSNGLTSGNCPSTVPPNPTVTLRLYNAFTNALIFQSTSTGTYSCADEGPEYIDQFQVSDSFTYFDNNLSTSNRSLRAEATFNNLPFGALRNQRLSILTQEA
jgi:hypothetical protein